MSDDNFKDRLDSDFKDSGENKKITETADNGTVKIPVETKDAADFVVPADNIKPKSDLDNSALASLCEKDNDSDNFYNSVMADKQDKAVKSAKAEKLAKPEKADKAEKAERQANSAKAEKPKKPAKKVKEKKTGEKSDKIDMKTRLADGAEYVKKTVRMIREATEQFRLDAEYEIPNRPEDVRYDDIVTPLAIKTDDAEAEDLFTGSGDGENEEFGAQENEKSGKQEKFDSDASKDSAYSKKVSGNKTSGNASGKSAAGKSQSASEKSKTAEVVDKYIIWRIIVNLIVSIAGIVLVIIFVPKIIKFFLPFIVAALLAAIATPLVKLIRKKFKITQKLGSAIVIILVIAAVIAMIYGIIVFLISQITKLVEERQVIVEALRNMMVRIGESLSGVYEVLPTNVQKFVSGTSEDFIEVIQEFANTLKLPSFADASSFLTASVDVVLGIVVCFIAAYFFTAQQAEIIGWLKAHTPESTLSYFSLIRDNFKKAIGGYFKAQFKIMLVLFAIMFIWFEIMDISFSALCAFGVAFLDFLPVFGMGAVFWPWIVIDIIGQKYSQAVLLAILYVICQLIRQLLQPKLVGDAVEMNPLETLVFMFIGYKIAGMWGLILGIPVGMILISLYKIGTFDRLTKGIKIIAKGINDFRKY